MGKVHFQGVCASRDGLDTSLGGNSYQNALALELFIFQLYDPPSSDALAHVIVKPLSVLTRHVRNDHGRFSLLKKEPAHVRDRKTFSNFTSQIIAKKVDCADSGKSTEVLGKPKCRHNDLPSN
jgi:hypothetical protein